ncbi:MAG: hypothetical protein Q9162_001147 [Coniocarpon cinnabarinum]
MEPGERRQLLQYAKHHGLLGRTSVADVHDLLASLKANIDVAGDAEDPIDAPTLEHITSKEPKEKLTISKDGAAFLHEIFTAASQPDVTVYDDAGRHRIKRLKFEEPLLRSEHYHDVNAYLRKYDSPPLWENYTSLLFSIDEDNDEGLEWTSRQKQLPLQSARELEHERLGVSRDALALLSFARDPSVDQSLVNEAVANDLKYQLKAGPSYLTPPLLPATPSAVSEISSPLAEYANPIEYTSPISKELNKIHADVQRTDNLVDGPEQDICDADYSTFDGEAYIGGFIEEGVSPQASPPRSKPWELKMDEPLVSPLHPGPKSVSFSDVSQETEPLLDAAVSCVDEPTKAEADAELEALFREIIEPTALKAQYELEHEKLQAADSTKRVKVPQLDLTLAVPPWKADSNPEMDQQETKTIMMAVSKLKLHHWPGMGKLELHMPWAPFAPNLGKVATKEHLTDEDALDMYLDVKDYDKALNADNLTWKPAKMKIFEESDDDDAQLEVAPLEDLLSSTEVDVIENRVSGEDSRARLRLRESDVLKDIQPPNREPDENHLRLHTDERDESFTPMFSASDDLARFMAMQGRPSEKPKTKTNPSAAQREATKTHIQPQRATSAAAALSQELVQLQTIDIPSFPTPEAPLSPCAIIASTKFMNRRSLIGAITSLWPDLTLIEREPTLLAPRYFESSHITVDDGDLTIAPSTAIICTTVLKIHQRPLPGQGNESRLKVRLRAVSQRFQNVTLIVGAPAGSSLDRISEQDIPAYQELVIFCSELPSNANAFVVLGGEDNLAGSIIGLIHSSITHANNVKLLPEQTHWELFLRRAGLNAFAAQAVLSMLKNARESSDASEDVDFGLARFLCMHRDERMEHFAELLGGVELLARVSDVLDAQWPVTHQKKTKSTT